MSGWVGWAALRRMYVSVSVCVCVRVYGGRLSPKKRFLGANNPQANSKVYKEGGIKTFQNAKIFFTEFLPKRCLANTLLS